MIPNNFRDLIRTIDSADHNQVIRTPVTGVQPEYMNTAGRQAWNMAIWNLMVASTGNLHDPPRIGDTLTWMYTVDAALINTTRHHNHLLQAFLAGEIIVQNRGRS